MGTQSCWTAKNMALCIIVFPQGPQLFAARSASLLLKQVAAQGRGLAAPAPPLEIVDWSTQASLGRGQRGLRRSRTLGRGLGARALLTFAATASCARRPRSCGQRDPCGSRKRPFSMSRRRDLFRGAAAGRDRRAVLRPRLAASQAWVLALLYPPRLPLPGSADSPAGKLACC